MQKNSKKKYCVDYNQSKIEAYLVKMEEKMKTLFEHYHVYTI